MQAQFQGPPDSKDHRIEHLVSYSILSLKNLCLASLDIFNISLFFMAYILSNAGNLPMRCRLKITRFAHRIPLHYHWRSQTGHPGYASPLTHPSSFNVKRFSGKLSKILGWRPLWWLISSPETGIHPRLFQQTWVWEAWIPDIILDHLHLRWRIYKNLVSLSRSSCT